MEDTSPSDVSHPESDVNEADGDRDNSHHTQMTTDISEDISRGIRVPKRQASQWAQDYLKENSLI